MAPPRSRAGSSNGLRGSVRRRGSIRGPLHVADPLVETTGRGDRGFDGISPKIRLLSGSDAKRAGRDETRISGTTPTTTDD